MHPPLFHFKTTDLTFYLFDTQYIASTIMSCHLKCNKKVCVFKVAGL